MRRDNALRSRHSKLVFRSVDQQLSFTRSSRQGAKLGIVSASRPPTRATVVAMNCSTWARYVETCDGNGS